MADISFLRNEDMEDTDQAMDDEILETTCDGITDGRSDEGGGVSLPPMTKLQQHASCNESFNRQLVGRILVEVFRGAVESGTELNVDEVMQPVLKLVNDTDPAVRLDLVEQLPHVAMICQEAPDRLGDVLPRHLIQIISTFLRDVDQQVRQSTHAALLALIDRGLLDRDSAEYVIAPTLLRMSQQTDRLELFTLAIDGMGKVARILGEETAERLFLNRYLALCKHPNFFVRKLCAIRLGEFSAAMRKEIVYEKLIPIYIRLCEDAVWTVRKSCIDVMVSFASCVSLQHRRETLSELLANFLTDDSKWVKSAACQILGPFISTFAKQFTGFSYNQYGELVLKDQHGIELRYNVLTFGGSAEPPLCKAVITGGQIVNFYEEEANVNSKIRRDTLPRGTDTNKENVPINHSTNKQWNIPNPLDDDDYEKDATIIHDYDEFNPFRYYYIPPNLPLDSELVQAAIVESTSKSPSEETQTAGEPDKTTVENEEQEDEDEIGEDNAKQDCTTRDIICNKQCLSFYRDEPEAPLCDKMERFEQQMGDIRDRLRKEVRLKRAPQTIVPHVLVDFFVSMAEPCGMLFGVEVLPHCAFSFPAVALTLGRENWPLLKPAYAELAEAREYRVRRTMASSIHELAMILGEDLAARDLLPIYEGFIKDLDEVRIGALKHLTTFVKVLRPADRRLFLPRLKAFLMLDNEGNWRFREEVARRLLEAIPLFVPSDVTDHIAQPLAFPLLIDKVAAVRQTALALMTQIIAYLSANESLVARIIGDLRYFLTSESSKWTSRQTFALLCSSLLRENAVSAEIFGTYLLPGLLDLSSDVVPNVRLAVVTALSRHVVNILDYLGAVEAEKVNQKLIQMRRDPDRDVRIVAGGIAGKYYPQGSEWKVPAVEPKFSW